MSTSLKQQEEQEIQINSRELAKAMLQYQLQNGGQRWIDAKKRVIEDVGTKSEIVDIFVNQLRIDQDKLNKNQSVSDCGLHTPRLGSHIDKETNIAHEIAFKLFPLEENEPEKKYEVRKRWSYLRYGRLVSSLARAFKVELVDEYSKKQDLKKIQLSGQRKNFCTLKHRPVPTSVTEPTPMPVDVAPIEELRPFFQFLGSGTPVLGSHQQFNRGTMFADGRMDLCKQVVGPPHISVLMNAIRFNPFIEHFLLGNNIIDIEGAEAIAEFIANPHVPKIKTWYLAGNRIDCQGMKLIAEALKEDEECESLWLKRNPIKAKGAKYLGEMLKRNNKIKVLDLHNTGLLDQGVSYLFKALIYNTRLRYLYVDANGVTAKGVKPICDYFRYLVNNKIKGVTSLWIDMNRLDDDGVIKMVSVLKDYPYLKRLCIGSNRISHVASDFVLQSFANHQKLMLLDLGLYKSTADMGELPNNIGDDGVDEICAFLEKNNSVKVMSIEHNGISAGGIDRIAQSLEKNDTMLYLYAKQYGICLHQSISGKMKGQLEKNIAQNLGVTFSEFMNEKLRILKHGKRVNHIDSIYRNSAK